MRPQAFTAATLAEAMQQVRAALGDDAVIVSTEEDPVGGVRILATAEPPAPPPPTSPPPPPPTGLGGAAYRAPDPGTPSAALGPVLAFHGVPDSVAGRLADGPSGPTLTATLAARLQGAFAFAPLPLQTRRPLLLAGPPGMGKTLAAAKLAARAVLGGGRVRLLTTDTGSAGAVDQIQAFAKALRLPLETAEGANGLATALQRAPASADTLTIIDTQGVNPLDGVDLAGLGAQIVAAKADPVLVLGAGNDAQESADTAEAFAGVGCNRLLVTRADLSRRLGGILAAAAAGLTITEIGSSPLLAHGLETASPDSLARLLIAQTQAPRAAGR